MTKPDATTLPAPPERIARIDVQQYHRMIETGILKDGAPIELIDGLLVYKDRSSRGGDLMSIGGPHNAIVSLLSIIGRLVEPFKCYLQTQGPLTLPPFNEPEPDGAIVLGDPRKYFRKKPGAADVTCVIEVADSSLDNDRTEKLAIYAASSIPQYLIINLVDDAIEVYEDPAPKNKHYRTKKVLGRKDRLSIMVRDDHRVRLPAKDLLP